jgi:SAM-dependent methyltransferase
MFKKDLDLVMSLHGKYSFKSPLLDAGGLNNPTIADYEISAKKAVEITVTDSEGTRVIKVPHSNQSDRYLKISRPWSFIDHNYTTLNPQDGDPYIEDLPEKYPEAFSTIIMVSVFEHVNNPYEVSDAIFKILKPGGYFFNSTPFLFPYHPSPEDNFRFSPLALRRIHEKSGFHWLEGDFHINHSTKEGIGDTNPANYGAPQAIMASYALCKKD